MAVRAVEDRTPPRFSSAVALPDPERIGLFPIPSVESVHAPYNPRAELIDATFGGVNIMDFSPIVTPLLGPVMGDWLSNIWDTATSWLDTAPDVPDLGGAGFDPGGGGGGLEYMPGELSTVLPGGGGEWGIPGAPDKIINQVLSPVAATPVSFGGALGMNTLTSLLGLGGGGAAKVMIKGVPVAMSRIWGWVKANPASMATIAAAAGMSVEALAGLMMAHPAGRRRRRRGISSRDVRTTRRVVNFVYRISSQLQALRPHSGGFSRARRGTTMIQQR